VKVPPVPAFDELTPAAAQVLRGVSLQHLEHRFGEGCRLVRGQDLAPGRRLQAL
jgi:hypothetical protein